MHVNFAAIFKQTMVENQRSRPWRKNKIPAGAEVNEI
jgi:hypothetical protein